MRIGKQDAPYSAICTSDAESITVRGKDLVDEIIGKMDFTSYFWFLVTGEEPNEDLAFFANAILCALAEHGLVPSVVAARMTLAAAPEALQGAVAAGLLGCGSVVLGSAEVAGRFYAECVADKHVAMMRALKAALPETIGRDLPININAAIPAILLDLGWPLAALKGIGLLCRTAGLVAHCTEEAERPIGFILSGAAAAAIEYDGPEGTR